MRWASRIHPDISHYTVCLPILPCSFRDPFVSMTARPSVLSNSRSALTALVHNLQSVSMTLQMDTETHPCIVDYNRLGLETMSFLDEHFMPGQQVHQ